MGGSQMIFRRASALVAVAFLMVAVRVTPTWAAEYPPGLQGEAVGVAGTKTGGGGGGVAGTSTGIAGSGLPNTGFDGVILLGGLAILLVGIGLIFASRRRGHTS